MITPPFLSPVSTNGLRTSLSFGNQRVLDGLALHVSEAMISAPVDPNDDRKTTTMQIFSTKGGQDT